MDGNEVNPATSQNCTRCGARLPAGALAGICPACLLRQGAAADTLTGAAAHPFEPSRVAELAPLFPQLEILALLGKGGMGAVYKARQTNPCSAKGSAPTADVFATFPAHQGSTPS